MLWRQAMIARNMASMTALALYRNAVQFGLNIAMTAFVAPSSYGLVTFTVPFMALAAMLTDMGLAAAITRAPALDREAAGAAFTLTLAVGAAIVAAMALLAGPIQHAVAMPGLAPVMRAMAVAVLLNIAATVPRALQERRLRYGTVAGIEAAAVFAGAAAGIALAFWGAGVWALVVYNIAVAALRAGGFLHLSRRELRPGFGWRATRPLLGFGGWVLAANLLNFAARNGDNLLIGASLGAAAVGVYGLAYQFMMVPLMAITWPASGILVATLRTRDGAESDRVVRGIVAATAMLTVPAMVLVAFAIRWPADALLSPRWREVPAIVAWLAPVGALQSVASYNGALLLAAGRARAQFALTVVNTIVLLATFVLALPYGLPAFVRAYAVATSVMSLGFLGLTVALTRFRWRDLGAAVMPAAAATAAGLLAAAATTGLAATSWPHWIAMVGIYAAAVIATYLAFSVRIRAAVAPLALAPQT